MLRLQVDQSWYEGVWLTERAPSPAARLSLCVRRVARHSARAMRALAAQMSLRLQQADESSPSFR
jgi:hypothetical protein